MNRTKTLFEENIRVGLIIGSIVLLLLVAPACSRTLEPTSEFDSTIPEENVESTRTNQQGQSEKLKEIEADASGGSRFSKKSGTFIRYVGCQLAKRNCLLAST